MSGASNFVKYAALGVLVAQNTFLVVFMRISRSSGAREMYAASTAVLCMELIKFATCLCVIAWESKGVHGLLTSLNTEVINKPMELVKLGVPSGLYVIQNNLLYYALSHLDTPTYMIGYQLKILTTALFATVMLGKKLSRLQWLSLVLLTIGVSLAQLHAHHTENTASHAKADAISDHPESPQKESTIAGFVAVLLAACTSGFSGIYFEKILKGSKTSLWIRNVQMGLSSIFIALFATFSQDGDQIREKGFFYGYNALVCVVVFLQACGGLVVAVVVKYADNILKGFAASFSIITACIISYFFLDFQPTMLFVCGAVLVLGSSYIYEKGLPPQLGFLRKSVPALFADTTPLKSKSHDMLPSMVPPKSVKEEV
jgi:UDP-sugar transporter A1/2/3